MKTINLRWIYPHYRHDEFVEVSDEIVDAFLLDKRAEAARERKVYRYKAFYSLDCNDGVENVAIGWMKPPKEKAICTKKSPPKRNRKNTSAKKF